jgi:PAS domain S-box-containing protein
MGGHSLLSANEELLRLALDSVRDYAIFMIDPGGRVITWNAGAERIKGYRADEILGQHFSRFYTDEAIRRGWPEMELARAAAEGRLEDEGWRVRKDGSQFWADVVFTAIRDEAGKLDGYLKITRDLTERRRAENSIRRLNEELEERVQGERAALHHADRGRNIGMGGDGNRRKANPVALHHNQQFQTRHAWQPEIEHQTAGNRTVAARH